MWRFGALLGLCLACGGSTEDTGSNSLDLRVSFQNDVRPIFLSKCVDCHHKASPTKLDLRAPFDGERGVINRANGWIERGSAYPFIVVPGKPEESALIAKVERSDLDISREGHRMPRQIASLSEVESATVERWIVEGANEDAFYRENVAPIFGTENSLGIRAGKCAWCHSTSQPAGGLDILRPFGPNGLVDVDSIASTKKRVVRGSALASFLMDKIRGGEDLRGEMMPKQIPSLTEEEIQTLKTWVLEGARNN